MCGREQKRFIEMWDRFLDRGIAALVGMLIGMAIAAYLVSDAKGLVRQSAAEQTVFGVNELLRSQEYAIRFRVNENGDLALVFPQRQIIMQDGKEI